MWYVNRCAFSLKGGEGGGGAIIRSLLLSTSFQVQTVFNGM